jgi:hypothetical protein
VQKGQLDITTEHRENPEFSNEDIETLIHFGELVSENEAQVETKAKKPGLIPINYRKVSGITLIN